MKGKKVGILIGVSAVVAAVGASVTVTQQNEYKLIRQFGKVDRVISSSGISFKIPFIESTQSLPKETLLYDLAASDVITKDKKTMISDSYVLWKISDPLKFAQTLNSSVENGESRINTAVYNATKNAISSMSQDQVITSRDGELSDMVMEAIGTNMDQYGIELLKFETKQLDLPDDNKEAVYERMISERDNIAATYKAEGNSEAKVIRNKTDKEVAIQISDAKKQAEILEAEGEQEYMKTIAAGGFRDITRIASSSPIMWEQICVENNQNISNVLDDYIRLLVQIKCFVDNKDSRSLYQMFASSRDYRDSIDVVDNGLLKKAYVLYLDIADEAGGIATIATILAMEKISIKNIGIIHNREFEEGVLKIMLYDDESAKKATKILRDKNYTVYERK